MKKVMCILMVWGVAVSLAPAGEIDTDGYYQMDSLELSGFDGAVGGTATLDLIGLNGTLTGIQGAGNNSWWMTFNPTDRAKLPYAMTGAKGWKLTATNTSTVGFNLALIVGNPSNWWQQGAGTWLNPGQTGTAYLDIVGPEDTANLILLFTGPGDSDIWTFKWVGVQDKSKPWNPSPEDEPAGASAVVLPETVLTWNTAMVKDPDERPNPAIRKHYVFGNFANPADPNLVYVGQVDAGDPVAATAQYPAAGTLNLAPLTVYKWQIMEGLDDGQGGAYPYTDPNGLIAGPIWTFKTASNEPIVTKNPVYTTVALAGTAVLTADFFSLYPISESHWYWSGDNGATFTALTNGAHPSGSGSTVAMAINESASPKTATLTINSAQAGDDGWYYCALTNQEGAGQSANAGLAVKRLVAYYPFEGSLADASGEGNDGTGKCANPAAIDLGYAAGVSGNAVVLNAVTASGDPNKTYIELPVTGYPKPAPGGAMEAGTLLFWYKSFGQGRLMGSANDSPDPTAFTVRVDGNFDVYINGTSNISNNPSLHVTLADDTWRFGAIRWQLGGENRIYAGYLNQNGISSVVTEAAAMTTFNDLDHPMIIGAENWRGTIGSFLNNAAIDELRIYNYPLSDTEIADLYNAISHKGLCVTGYANQYDFNSDCIVSLSDFAELAASWLSCGVLPQAACGN